MKETLVVEARFETCEEGGYTVYVPALPEVITEGDTFEEAHAAAQEAIRCALEVRAERGEPLTDPKPRARAVPLRPEYGTYSVNLHPDVTEFRRA